MSDGYGAVGGGAGVEGTPTPLSIISHSNLWTSPLVEEDIIDSIKLYAFVLDLKLNPIDDEYTQKWPDSGCHCHVDNDSIAEDNDYNKGDDDGNEEDLEDDDDNEEDVRMKSC